MSKAKLVGYKKEDAARERSREVTTSNPSIVQLLDGSFVAKGDTIVTSGGARFALLYGARKSNCTIAQARAAGLLPKEEG